jgi:hypothetical protein
MARCLARIDAALRAAREATQTTNESTSTGRHQNLNVTNCKFGGVKTPMLFRRSSMHFSYNHLGLLLVVSLMPAFARKASQLQRLPVG